VALFAAEPLLVAKPLALAFDAAGRLFVVESIDYPNDIVLPGEGQGRDRIVMLTDGDGDGAADTRTVYAEGLSIPTSLLHHDGGFIVAQAPSMLYLKDADGDGRAEIRRELFSGWGTRDTHSGPSSLAGWKSTSAPISRIKPSRLRASGSAPLRVRRPSERWYALIPTNRAKRRFFIGLVVFLWMELGFSSGTFDRLLSRKGVLPCRALFRIFQ
jgi:hypothetical protein